MEPSRSQIGSSQGAASFRDNCPDCVSGYGQRWTSGQPLRSGQRSPCHQARLVPLPSANLPLPASYSFDPGPLMADPRFVPITRPIAFCCSTRLATRVPLAERCDAEKLMANRLGNWGEQLTNPISARSMDHQSMLSQFGGLQFKAFNVQFGTPRCMSFIDTLGE